MTKLISLPRSEGIDYLCLIKTGYHETINGKMVRLGTITNVHYTTNHQLPNHFTDGKNEVTVIVNLKPNK
jgi:hypothetical protein